MGQNRKCQVCGNTYSYCPNCGQNTNIETWKLIYDTTNCRDIADICREFKGKSFTATEALNKINEIGIPNNLTEYMKKSIDFIKSKIDVDKNTEIVVKEIEIQEVPESIEVQPSPIVEEPKAEEVSIEVSEEPKSEESSVEQPSLVKGFRKRRLERQKKNEEN